VSFEILTVSILVDRFPIGVDLSHHWKHFLHLTTALLKIVSRNVVANAKLNDRFFELCFCFITNIFIPPRQ
jgi:hypothetical protein